MARVRTTKLLAVANVALLRSPAQCHNISQAASIHKLEHENHESVEYKKRSYKMVADMDWVPHPRSGIYYPQGQGRVLDDVPSNAASLGQCKHYWIRNVDGAEKHDPDISSADHYLLAPHKCQFIGNGSLKSFKSAEKAAWIQSGVTGPANEAMGPNEVILSTEILRLKYRELNEKK